MRISDANGKMRISDADVETRLGGRKDRSTCILAMSLFDNAHCLHADPCGPMQWNKAQENGILPGNNKLPSQDSNSVSVLVISSVSKHIFD